MQGQTKTVLRRGPRNFTPSIPYEKRLFEEILQRNKEKQESIQYEV